MYNLWSYILDISQMQTNADYDTKVTRMSVYYIQYEKNNKCVCYNIVNSYEKCVHFASTYITSIYAKKQWISLCK